MLKRKNYSLLSDAELIQLSQRNAHYFAHLYDRYFEVIFRFVFKRLSGDEASASDVTQNTFMKALHNIGKYKDMGFPFSSWLYRIAINEVNLHYRAAKANKEVEIDMHGIRNLQQEITEEFDANVDNTSELIRVLNTLNEDQKELIELRFFQELAFKEIAEIYAITEANAKMRIYRILEKLNNAWSK